MKKWFWKGKMPIGSNPDHPGKEWYEELCALAAIGELSSSEFEELQKHLAECGDCRQAYADFCRISAGDLGLVAAVKQSEETADEAGALVDENAALGRLLDRATQENVNRRTDEARSNPEPEKQGGSFRFASWMRWLRRPALSYASLGLILCALAAIGAYRLREAQLTPKLDSLSSEISEWKNQARAGEKREASVSQQLKQSEDDRDRLRKALADAEAKYAELRTQQQSLEVRLVAGQAHIDQQGQELEAAKSGVEEKNQEIGKLEARVQAAVQRTEEQRNIAADLQSRLQYMQQTAQQQAANTPEAQGFGDVEAKELFGARDLHIVDVYDVDSNGTTKRTYGRVYYVEKKLLMFYAFDLQSKGRNRAPASFQAWGYRESNQSRPESLGLFSMDDPSVNRWVLKVNNPRVLEHVDAVFVTAEGPNGSPSPRGRKVLYANLAGPANHP